MSFLPSLASVIGAVVGLAIAAPVASADPIPGPPLPVPARDRAGEFCPARTSAGGSAAGFAAGVAVAAIAGRRRDLHA